MIPIILSIITSIIIYTSNKIDNDSRIMITFIVFVLTLWLTNKTIFNSLKTEEKFIRIKIINPIPKRGINCIVFDSIKIKCKELKFVKHRRIKNPYVLVRVERKILPTHKKILLTYSSLWFNKINKWKQIKNTKVEVWSNKTIKK